MTRETWLVEGVLGDKDKGFNATLLRALLTPLATLHQIGLEVYLAPFHLGLRKRYHLPVPVISLGNLSSGGTGKTPATALVAKLLKSLGKRVVILSRGHRGQGEKESEPRIVSDGEKRLLSPAQAGDEPVLLASLLPDVPIIVCRDRRKSGKLAIERFSPDVIVLDDGLQYWQLHRDLDIVLLDARRPFDNGYVLPRGLLREPPTHLSRAGLVVLTRADRVSDTKQLEATLAYVQTLTRPEIPVLTATHAPIGWVRSGSPETLLPVEALAGCSGFVFAGIADSTSFVETVAKLGVSICGTRALGDHHDYTDNDIREIRQSLGENVLAITTEKDAVKIAALAESITLPLVSLRIVLQINNELCLQKSLESLF